MAMDGCNTKFVVVCVSLAVLFYSALCDTPTKPKVYKVNLDLPEEDRWVHVVQDFSGLVPLMNKIINQMVPEQLKEIIEMYGDEIDNYLPEPFSSEIRGISKALGIKLADVALLNIVYELSAFCTSIVAQNKNGQIWHGRNLDYQYTDILRNITIVVHYQRNNTTVYSGVTYAGYVGLLTAQKPKSFTITADERDQGAWWKNLAVAIIDKNASAMGFLIRQTVESQPDWSSAVQHISSVITVADGYYIIGGVNPGEGAVVTKNRLDTADIWNLAPDSGRWFLVETNYDHWTTPKPGDDRRTPAIKGMQTVGQGNINGTTLFKVLSTRPVLNGGTTYTAIMSAADPDVFDAWIRHV